MTTGITTPKCLTKKGEKLLDNDQKDQKMAKIWPKWSEIYRSKWGQQYNADFPDQKLWDNGKIVEKI